MIWAQTCFCGVVPSFVSRLSSLSIFSRQIDAPCSVCPLPLSQGWCAHKNSFTWVGFCLCFMGTSSRSKSVLGECADLDMLTYLLDMLFSFIIAYPFDAQRIVKCLLHCSAFALLSYCLGCMAKLKVCIHSRGDWTNWKRSFYCGVFYAQKLCLHEEVQ